MSVCVREREREREREKERERAREITKTGEVSAGSRAPATYHFTEMCSGSEAGSYLRLIDLCITQLQARE